MVHIPVILQDLMTMGCVDFLEGPYDTEKTKQELLQVEALAPQFAVQFEQSSLLYRVCALAAKVIGCVVYLPYSIVHLVAGLAILPATLADRKMLAQPRLDMMKMNPNDNWMVKRTAIYLNVEGVTIDVCLMGKQKNLHNGKWLLTAMLMLVPMK